MVTHLQALFPLHLSQRGHQCSSCDAREARWQVRLGKSPAYICSMCVLYDSRWGELNRVNIDAVLAQVKQHRPDLEVVEGRVTQDKAADDLLGVIVLADRTRQQMGGQP